MIITFTTDARKNHFRNLNSTSFIDIIDTVADKFQYTIERVLVSAGTGGADFTLTYNNGTSDFIICNAVTIPANTTYPLPDNFHLRLSKGDTLKAKASVADKLCVFVVTIDHMPVQSNGGMGGYVAGTGGMNIGRA